jgi:hypothetical protein
MTMSQHDSTRPDGSPAGKSAHEAPHDELESYGGGHIQARHGRVNGWLLVVYLVLFLWSLYYGYHYWGGLGPGLDY